MSEIEEKKGQSPLIPPTSSEIEEKPLLEPTVEEKYIIKQLGDLYPQLDYQMLLVLVKASKEDINSLKKEFADNPPSFEPMTYSVLKGGMSIEKTEEFREKINNKICI